MAMENKNFEYKGWKANGFVALFLILGLMVLGVLLIIWGVNLADTSWDRLAKVSGVSLILFGALLQLALLISLAGFMLLEPNEAQLPSDRFLVGESLYVGQAYLAACPQPECRAD